MEEEKSPGTSASIARCNICSTLNRNVSVICEGRCLICIRCQLTPTIRKLFVSSPVDCPLCDHPMSRTMMRQVHSFGSLASLSNVSNSFDLEAVSSPYGAFLKRYRSTYPATLLETGQGYGYQLTEKELESVSAAGPNLGGAATTTGGDNLFMTAVGGGGAEDRHLSSPTGSRPGTASDGSKGVATAKGGKKGAEDDGGLRREEGAVPAPKMTMNELLDFALECYGLMWGVIARQGNEGMCAMTLRFCSKKRLSQRSNDFKMKSFLDFYFENRQGKDGLESSPHAVLFGKIVGLLPRRRPVVRKAWGAVGLAVLAFAYVEKCWKSSELVDSESNPPPAEVKTKLNKLHSNKQLPLKRVLQIVGKLNESNQAHWTMAPFKAACEEYNARQPWARDSQSRLMHMIIYTALWVNGRIKEVTTGSGSLTVVLAPGGIDPLDEKLRHHLAPSNGATNGATLHPQAAALRREHSGLHKGVFSKDKDRDDGVKDEITSVVGIKLLRALTAKASQLWAARIHILSTAPTLADVMRFSEQGTVAEITPEMAAELCGRMTIGICEAAVALIDSWEAEYMAFQIDMRKALVSTSRRPAIAGSYNSRHAELNRVERLAVIRLLKYHNEQDHLGVDWTSIKGDYDQGQPLKYPFLVPASLLEKTVAELNYHAVRVIAQYEKDKAKEFIEDLVAASGPYAKTPLQPSRPPRSPSSRPGRAGALSRGEADPFYALDASQIKAVHRAEYLAGQVLGKDVPTKSATPGRSRPNSAYVPLPLPFSHDDDQSFVTQVQTVQSDALDELSSSVNLTGISDPRPSLHAYITEQQHISRPGSPEDLQSLEMLLNARDLAISAGEQLERAGQSRPTSSAEALTFVPPGQSRARAPVQQPLSTVPYASPLPARHVVSMVDVLDNDASVLAKVRLLSAVPVGPSTSKSRLRSLDEELFGALEDEMSFEDATENEQVRATPTTTTKTTGTSSAAPVIDSSKQALLEQMTAKQRVWARAEERRKALQAKEDKLRSDRIEARARRAAEEPLLHREVDPAASLTRVDLKSALGLERRAKKGSSEPPGPAQSVESKLASEQSVQMLLLTDMTAEATVGPDVWIAITDSYLKPFQMQTLLKMDFTRACMGALGGIALSKALRVHCRLLDLRLGGNEVGDTACGKIIASIAAGGGGSTLLVLDLSGNNLTMISDGLGGLSQLSALQLLDLSHNKLTLDLARHHEILRRAISNLPALAGLSLAHNRIQDAGFSTLTEVLLHPTQGLPSLRFLDLKKCFISPKSFGLLEHLIKEPSINSREWASEGIQLQENILTNEQMKEISYVAAVRDMPVVFRGESKAMWETIKVPYQQLMPGTPTAVQQEMGSIIEITEPVSAGDLNE